jgi:integrase
MTPENSEIENQKGRFQKVAECLYRHCSSKVYYALIKRSGKQYRRSLETTDRKIAERKLTDYRNQVAGLARTTGSAKMTFSELAKLWVTSVAPNLKAASLRRLNGVVRQLEKTFGNVPVRSITPQLCEDYAARRGAGTSASTFNKDREGLTAILNYAKREGLLLVNPAAGIKRRKLPKSKTVIPSHEEFRKLVETLRNKDSRYWGAADMVELLAYSGMRLAEASAIRWNDVDFARESFVVTGGEYGTKNHEARTVPLFPSLRRHLETMKALEPAEDTANVAPVGKSYKALETACREANISRFTHHTLRHYFVSNAIETGVDFKTIAAWIGHKDGGILVAQTYGHLRDTHSKEMAKRMTFAA